jgi:hypothetical protein
MQDSKNNSERMFAKLKIDSHILYHASTYYRFEPGLGRALKTKEVTVLSEESCEENRRGDTYP